MNPFLKLVLCIVFPIPCIPLMLLGYFDDDEETANEE